MSEIGCGAGRQLFAKPLNRLLAAASFRLLDDALANGIDRAHDKILGAGIGEAVSGHLPLRSDRRECEGDQGR